MIVPVPAAVMATYKLMSRSVTTQIIIIMMAAPMPVRPLCAAMAFCGWMCARVSRDMKTVMMAIKSITIGAPIHVCSLGVATAFYAWVCSQLKMGTKNVMTPTV